MSETSASGQHRRPTIAEIFNSSGTDKLWRHGYHRYYHKILAPYREMNGLRMLEIGAKEGKSLHAWEKYFPNVAAIQGIAYRADPEKATAEACADVPQCKVTIFTVDQSSPSELENMTRSEQDKLGESHLWDVIIDDGSHVPMHQLIAFKHLFPHVRFGGVYVVEDVETSFMKGEVYGYKFDGGIFAEPGRSAVEKFKELVEVVNRKHMGHEDFTVFGHDVDADVSEVSFVDGMIVIFKKPGGFGWDKYPVDSEILYKVPRDEIISAEKKIASQIPIP